MKEQQPEVVLIRSMAVGAGGILKKSLARDCVFAEFFKEQISILVQLESKFSCFRLFVHCVNTTLFNDSIQSALQL